MRRQYSTLDGLRGVAALAVVILHAPYLFGGLMAPSASLAVDLFFVMSGFIIAHAYEEKLAEGLSRGRFIFLRLVRLYPLYLLGLGLGLAEAFGELAIGRAQAWTVSGIFTAGLSGLFMLPSATGPLTEGGVGLFPLNPPGWSLMFEMAVNVAYAFLLPVLTSRRLVWIAVTSAAVLVGFAATYNHLALGSHWDGFAGGLARVSFSFSVGVLLHRHAKNGIGIRVPPLLILATCGALFLVDAGQYRGIYDLACVLLILPLMVALGVSVEPVGPAMQRAFAFLGPTSYGVYCLHYPLAMATKGAIGRLRGMDTALLPAWVGVAFFACLLTAVWLLDRLYDGPVRRWILAAQPLRAAVRQS